MKKLDNIDVAIQVHDIRKSLSGLKHLIVKNFTVMKLGH